MPRKLRDSRNEYWRAWYKLNRQKCIRWVQKRKERNRKWYKELKKNYSCNVCGENHPACIDFHHTSKKEREIFYMVNQGFSEKTIMDEIQKCTPLCSNCHRKLHYNGDVG